MKRLLACLTIFSFLFWGCNSSFNPGSDDLNQQTEVEEVETEPSPEAETSDTDPEGTDPDDDGDDGDTEPGTDPETGGTDPEGTDPDDDDDDEDFDDEENENLYNDNFKVDRKRVTKNTINSIERRLVGSSGSWTTTTNSKNIAEVGKLKRTGSTVTITVTKDDVKLTGTYYVFIKQSGGKKYQYTLTFDNTSLKKGDTIVLHEQSRHNSRIKAATHIRSANVFLKAR